MKKQGMRESLWQFNKATQFKDETHPKKVAGEINFNDFPDKNGDKVDVEVLLAKFEDKIAPALKAFCSNPTPANLKPYKSALAHFVALQLVRTPTTRREINDLFQLMIRPMVEDKFGKVPDHLLPVLSEDTVKGQQALLITDTVKNIRWIKFMKWIIHYNRTGKPYWTSDCPVVRHNEDMSFRGGLGLASPGVQFMTPLSPEVALVICEPYTFQLAPPLYHATLGDVDFFNSRQVIFSKQYLFSIDSDFSIAQEMIKEDPIYGDIDHPRVFRMGEQ